MVDYGKSKAVKKGKKEDFGKIHREGITGMLERQYFNDISPQNNPHLNKYHKNDYQTAGKRVINLNNNGSMRCSHERSSAGLCK